MKRTLLALAVITMFVSCKKTTNQIPEKEKEILSTDIEVGVTTKTIEAMAEQEGSAKYNFLGYGYDVTKEYDDASSVRASIIDIPAFVSNNPQNFNLDRSAQAYWKTINAANAVDLFAQFSQDFAETKALKVFGNTLRRSFNTDNVLDKKYVYGYYFNIIEWKRLGIVYRPSTYNDLRGSFVEDYNVLSAEDLVKKYGTHVLIKIKIGAKFNVIYQAETRNVERKRIGAVGLRFVLRKIFGLSTGEIDELNMKDLNENSSAKIFYYTTGGDGSKLKINSTTKTPTISIADWRSSATEDKSRFIGVAADGLLPLYELIENRVKKEEVKIYIRKYISEREVVSND